jgi:hypothetical protein
MSTLVQFELTVDDTQLSRDQADQLRAVLGIASDRELIQRLVTIALAEYRSFFFGPAPPPTRVADILEPRLLAFIRDAFVGQIPSEDQVARLFRVDRTRARTLLKNVGAHYPEEIQKRVRVVAGEALAGASRHDSRVAAIFVWSPAVLDLLNQIVDDANHTAGRTFDYRRISSYSGVRGCYLVPGDTYTMLCKALHVQAVDIE